MNEILPGMAILLDSTDDPTLSNSKRFHLIIGFRCPCIIDDDDDIVARHFSNIDFFKPIVISEGFSRKLGGSIFSTKKKKNDNFYE